MKGYEKAAQAIQSVKQVIIGKDDCVLAIMEAILANGHILIEDIPGVGKTSMALAFARVLDMKQSRVQFTPDVLPTVSNNTVPINGTWSPAVINTSAIGSNVYTFTPSNGQYKRRATS